MLKRDCETSNSDMANPLRHPKLFFASLFYLFSLLLSICFSLFPRSSVSLVLSLMAAPASSPSGACSRYFLYTVCVLGIIGFCASVGGGIYAYNATWETEYRAVLTPMQQARSKDDQELSTCSSLMLHARHSTLPLGISADVVAQLEEDYNRCNHAKLHRDVHKAKTDAEMYQEAHEAASKAMLVKFELAAKELMTGVRSVWKQGTEQPFLMFLVIIGLLLSLAVCVGQCTKPCLLYMSQREERQRAANVKEAMKRWDTPIPPPTSNLLDIKSTILDAPSSSSSSPPPARQSFYLSGDTEAEDVDMMALGAPPSPKPIAVSVFHPRFSRHAKQN